jgi:hypothetical protein
MIIYKHNTGKQIDQVPFRISLVEALFEQFADTELKVAGHRTAENIIPRLRERHFTHKVPPPSGGGGGVHGMHQTRTEVLWLQRDAGLCLEASVEAYHTKLSF